MDGFPPGSIWPADGFDAVQIREVYSRYGLAMYYVQVAEHSMVNAVIVIRTLPTMRTHPNPESWQAAFDKAYEGGLSLTYGNMLRQLATLDDFPPELLAKLRDAKEDRDILAHRFFRENDLAFMNPEGRTHMIAWCERRIELFQSLTDELEALLAPIQERHGISREWVERAYKSSLEQARNWSPPDDPRS